MRLLRPVIVLLGLLVIASPSVGQFRTRPIDSLRSSGARIDIGAFAALRNPDPGVVVQASSGIHYVRWVGEPERVLAWVDSARVMLAQKQNSLAGEVITLEARFQGVGDDDMVIQRSISDRGSQLSVHVVDEHAVNLVQMSLTAERAARLLVALESAAQAAVGMREPNPAPSLHKNGG